MAHQTESSVDSKNGDRINPTIAMDQSNNGGRLLFAPYG